MKGLILSGGKGSRLRPFTYTGAKQLVPVANKPVLFYAIDMMRRSGITDVGIVVGDTREQVVAAVEAANGHWGLNITYIDQPEPLGLAHAIQISQDFLGKEKFLMILGDNLWEDDLSAAIKRFAASPELSCVLALKAVPNPQASGVIEIENGRVLRAVEKPKEPRSNLIATGFYLFDHHAFECFDGYIKPSARGELEITSVIQFYVDRGYNVGYEVLSGWWCDTGKMTDLLDANHLVLSRLAEGRIDGRLEGDSQTVGPVVVEEGSEIVNSHIRGPAVVGRGCRIVNSYIGPFTSIYHDVELRNSEIEYSIVLENSRILDIPHRIENSLIGRNVTVQRSLGKPKAITLELGDHSKVGLL